MTFTLNLHKFLHTMYKYVPNLVVNISQMFSRYFDYYTWGRPSWTWSIQYPVTRFMGGVFCRVNDVYLGLRRKFNEKNWNGRSVPEPAPADRNKNVVWIYVNFLRAFLLAYR